MAAITKTTIFWVLALFVLGETGVRLTSQDDSHGALDFGFRSREGLSERDGNLVIRPTLQRRFRAQVMPITKEPDSLRVFVYGDSVARGSAGIRAYADCLADSLGKSGISAEVVNFAAVGAGVRKQQTVLEGTLRFGPDIVVLHLNTHNEGFDERDWKERERFLHWHPHYWLAQSRMFRLAGEWKRDHLYQEWLPGMAGPLWQGNDKFILWEAPDPELYRRRRARVAEVTRQNVSMARAAGARVLLVSPVQVSEAAGKYVFEDEGYDRFCAGLESAEVKFVSMKEIFRGRSPYESHLRGDGVHLDQGGHSRLGEKIAGKLMDCGWTRGATAPGRGAKPK